MADLVKTAKKLASGITPIAVGLILVNNVSIIPFVPQILHTIAGWAIVASGVLDIIGK